MTTPFGVYVDEHRSKYSRRSTQDVHFFFQTEARGTPLPLEDLYGR